MSDLLDKITDGEKYVKAIQATYKIWDSIRESDEWHVSWNPGAFIEVTLGRHRWSFDPLQHFHIVSSPFAYDQKDIARDREAWRHLAIYLYKRGCLRLP